MNQEGNQKLNKVKKLQFKKLKKEKARRGNAKLISLCIFLIVEYEDTIISILRTSMKWETHINNYIKNKSSYDTNRVRNIYVPL